MFTICTFKNISKTAGEALEYLGEVIRFDLLEDTIPGSSGIPYLILEEDTIQWPHKWHNQEPPVLFPPTSLNKNALMAIALTKLGHYDLALKYTTDPDLEIIIRCFKYLTEREGLPDLTWGYDYYGNHNRAILYHYTRKTDNGSSPAELYEMALAMAPDPELASFTARHYGVYLFDRGHVEHAEELLRNQIMNEAISEDAQYTLKFDLVSVLAKKLAVPYDQQLIAELKTLIGETLEFYESRGMDVQAALLLAEASEVANIEENYTESLGYINRAIATYRREELTEFLANAFFRKGTLLYTWAQNGNPQFFKSAAETYQEALKTFKKHTSPAVFAEIHHNLGVIYAEMPTDPKQEGIMAAVSASSFKESLEYFSKDGFPYNYAMITNNYANALMKYPAARNGDNFEKAIYYFKESLEIRNAGKYPLERAHTILNYLEACWRVHNINSGMERVRYRDMVRKALEVKKLTTDTELITQAEEHLKKLKELSRILTGS